MGTFIINAHLEIDTSLVISAKSINHALEKARELKVIDFVDIKGEYESGKYVLRGVWADENKDGEVIEE